ncbi:hypothetical protein [Ramlibacter sp. WS9]|uniref:hypothetical protein n=1 Tax=Ramlibacter sp. WS9 TaxID=1882741 RepID=UPI0011434825|nr:hypothetical protein [Ramlibacter sp. WS9]ROZ71473.1 hypothetical protein EEB15_20715 [Ramlibacter sp. WS9]
MKSPAFTIKVFGVYVVLTGITLLLIPNVMMSMLGAPEAKDVYVRVLGALAIVVGYYYWACGVGGATAFFKATIPGRLLFFALGVSLVLLAGAHPTLIGFGLVDVAGAAWTWMALRATGAGSLNAA